MQRHNSVDDLINDFVDIQPPGRNPLGSYSNRERQVLDEKKPILRLATRESFEQIPQNLRHAIIGHLGLPPFTEWIQDNFNIRIIADDERFGRHYQDRIAAINEGCSFLLGCLAPQHPLNNADYVPTRREQLAAHLKTVANTYMQKLAKLDESTPSFSIAHYQNFLADYLRLVLETLEQQTGINGKDLLKQLARAEDFALTEHRRLPVCTVTTLSDTVDEYIATVDVPISPFDEAMKHDLMAIKNKSPDLPDWFLALEDFEKIFLIHFLEHKDISNDVGVTINALSSKLRIIPALANFGSHTLITCKNGQSAHVHSPEYRSSHIASRDMITKNDAIRHLHAKANLENIILTTLSRHLTDLGYRGILKPGQEFTVPLLYQTLITPIKQPDRYLEEERLRVLYQMSTNYIFENTPIKVWLLPTNHPLNYGKYVEPTLPGTYTARSIANLIQIAKSQTAYADERGLLRQVCDKLESCTRDTLKMIHPYRELYLSSLEQVTIGALQGISIGSCVSGKDRKAIELILTDAMKIYFECYGSLPPLEYDTPADLANMVKIAKLFAELYCTKHQQLLASQNAPGSFGTKTPAMYLPQPFQDAVKAWIAAHAIPGNVYEAMQTRDTFKESNLMANNNDLKCIKSREIPKEEIDWVTKPTITKQIYSLDMIVMLKQIDSAFDAYLKHRKANLNFFMQNLDWERRRLKVTSLKGVFSHDGIEDNQKIMILYALFCGKQGGQLLKYVSVHLGFVNAEAVRSALGVYLFNHFKLDNVQNKMRFLSVIEKVIAIIEKPSQIDLKTTIEDLKHALRYHRNPVAAIGQVRPQGYIVP